MGKIIHHSVFKGEISVADNDGWDTIALKSDNNNFKIDLVDRFKEIIMNLSYTSNYNYRILIFIGDNKTKFEDVDGNWSVIEEAHYIKINKYSRDVQYFDDWEDTVCYTDFKIGGFNVYEFLKSRVGKWTYIKFEVIQAK